MLRHCRIVFEVHMLGRITRHMPKPLYYYKLKGMPQPIMGKTAKFMPQHFSMMSQEKNLPHLPVPPLQQTMDKYLKAVRPLVNNEDYEYTKEVVEDFRKPGGIGEKLQVKLLERAKTRENWLAEWWDNVAYLEARVPVVINYNPAATFPKEYFNDRVDYLRYSARLITNVLKFRHLIDNDLLEIDMLGNSPLAMNQYKLFLCGCRIPQASRDKYYVAPTGKSKHIVVIHRNQFYSFDVYDKDSKPLSESDLAKQLIKVVENTEPLAEPVGVLTSDDRTAWARERRIMAKDRTNRANFELIENSIFALCLDCPPLPSTQAPSAMEEPTNSVTARQVLHGDGIHHNTLNRWFDKPLEFCVSEDGHCGCCYEHTSAEGPTVARLWEYVMKNRIGYGSITVSDSPSNLPHPSKLNWNLKQSTKDNIEKAQYRLDSFVNDVDVRCFMYSDYGKDFIKKQKLSPDAWIQVSFQLTFYRLHGHMAPTYETGSTRKFKLGRTDTIRSATCAAEEFAKAMTSPGSSNAERLTLMRNAVRAHTQYTKEAISGQAIDRHLLGLKLTAVESGINLPDLFMDSTYQYAFHFKLSTSQVAFDEDSYLIFGPAVPDGYGVCYNPMPNKLLVSVTSYNSNPVTNPGHFAAYLQRSLDDMQLLATTAKL